MAGPDPTADNAVTPGRVIAKMGPMATPNAARELRAEAEVDAPAEHVWALLTDFAQLASWSPETVRMVPLKRGGLRVGQWYLGINRRKGFVWPTRSVVADVVPGRRLAWDTPSSGAQWVWELEPVDAAAPVWCTAARCPRG